MPAPTVAELIELLAARSRVGLLHDRRTGLPYSWSGWLRSWVSKAAPAYARAEMIDTVAARPAPPRAAAAAAQPLWRVMLLLLWHGGEPPPRDQRGLRWFAAFFSAVLHVMFAALLVWVALVRSNVPDERAGEGERVQVEYIGSGTPQEEGGGTPTTASAQVAKVAQGNRTAGGEPAQAQPDAGDAPVLEPEMPPWRGDTAQAEPAEDAESMPVDVSEPTPQPSPEQPLQATEVLRPTSDFVVPPPSVTAPALRAPEPQVRERSVEIAAERPQLTQPVRTPSIAAPRVNAPLVQVRERQIEVIPQQQVTMTQVAPRDAPLRVRTPEVGVRERQIAAAPTPDVAMASVRSHEADVRLKGPDVSVRERQLPGVPEAPVSAATPAPGDARAPASATGVAGTNAAAKSDATSGSSPGAGPKPQDRSGGWAAPARADDWGTSQRQVAGNAGGQADKGLFNADGSVRLPGENERGQETARGAPGGDSDTWSRERIAQSGTWLKRPPYDHTPTSLDKYWVPNESLLAEWVRKGIKSIEIPIPGTKTKLSCVVSMLQFGGGCGLSNPDMQEQPASARPPPDVPFKQELQEDNGSR